MPKHKQGFVFQHITSLKKNPFGISFNNYFYWVRARLMYYPNVIKVVFIILFSLSIISCGGGGDSGSDVTQPEEIYEKGRFLDSAVEGIQFESSGESGITDNSGTFTYEEGQHVKFTIGSIEIGSTIGLSIITPLDIVADANDIYHPTVVNIVRFLQSIDNDANPENGITIIEEQRRIANGMTIDFAQDEAIFENDSNVVFVINELTEATDAGTRGLISSLDAMNHFAYTLSSMGTTSSQLSGDLSERWDSTEIKVYSPMSDMLIEGDIGRWTIDDTVSNFPECGDSENKAELIDDKSLRLTANNSNSDCADNIWVTLFTKAASVLDIQINPTLSIPLVPGTSFSFKSSGVLVNPQSASPRCIGPPCGDTISVSVEESGGTRLAYVLQRAPDAKQNTTHDIYREVFLDPDAGEYSRDLYADFETIPAFTGGGVEHEIVSVTFEVSNHGSGTIDNIMISDSEISIGFWGAGSTKAFGNTTLDDFIATPLQATMFPATGKSGPAAARLHLLTELDGENGDKYISATEVGKKTVKVFGYSMGGAAALQFAQSFSQAGTNFGAYEIETGIPIAALVTIDPVIPDFPFLTFPEKCNLSYCNIPETVRKYKNYFQRQGGATKFTLIPSGDPWPIGNALSDRIKGFSVGGANEIKIPDGWPDEPEEGFACNAVGCPKVKLHREGVGHDGVPWFVKEDALSFLKE